MSKADYKCGFCKQGVEAENICGKLWHDKNNKCTSHQRCMQYSALLVQYQMKKFGGFKVKKVLKEQNRGKLLKCSICCKSSKKSKNNFGGGATAGCAISRCKKTFHFYCAKLDRNARTRRIVLRNSSNLNDSDEPQILYRVFCSEEHEEMFKKNQKNIDYSEDTDNEEYKSDYTLSSSDSSDSSDGSGDENESVDKKTSSVKKELSSNNDTNISSHPTANEDKSNAEKNSKLTLPKKRLNVSNDKRDEDISNNKKLKTSNFDDNHVICFVENAEHLVPSKFEVLVKRAKELFDADASKVFLWKYNLDRFTSQHMLYLLLDISQALCAKNDFEIKRLVCLLDNKDIERYEQLMKRSADEDCETNNDDQDKKNDPQICESEDIKPTDNDDDSSSGNSKLEVKNKMLRQKIDVNLENANEKVNQLVGKYCLLNMPEETHIVFLALCDITDPQGEIRYHMKRPNRVKKDVKTANDNLKSDEVEKASETDNSSGLNPNDECSKNIKNTSEEELLEDVKQESTKKIMNESTIDAALFPETLTDKNIDYKNIKEESDLVFRWLTDTLSEITNVIHYPTERLLIKTFKGGSHDEYCHYVSLRLLDRLKAVKKSVLDNSESVILISLLDSTQVNVLNYISKRISESLNDLLAMQHEIYFVIDVDETLNISRCADILPPMFTYGDTETNIKVKVYKPNVKWQSSCFVLHFWIDCN